MKFMKETNYSTTFMNETHKVFFAAIFIILGPISNDLYE